MSEIRLSDAEERLRDLDKRPLPTPEEEARIRAQNTRKQKEPTK